MFIKILKVKQGNLFIVKMFEGLFNFLGIIITSVTASFGEYSGFVYGMSEK